MIGLKLAFLVVAIMYGFTCFGRLLTKEAVHMGQIFIMAIGIVGFLALQLNWI